MRIKDLCKEAHDRAVRKGFYDPPPDVEAYLCRIHAELSEADEAYRDGAMITTFEPNGKPIGFPSEIADAVIRLCDLAERHGIDLEREIRLKSDYNETRPMKHGRAR